MRATLRQTFPSRDKLAYKLDEITGHFRRQRNVALHHVKFEQRQQDHGETLDHFTLRFENWLLTRAFVEPTSTIVSRHASCQGLLLKTYERSYSLSTPTLPGERRGPLLQQRVRCKPGGGPHTQPCTSCERCECEQVRCRISWMFSSSEDARASTTVCLDPSCHKNNLSTL